MSALILFGALCALFLVLALVAAIAEWFYYREPLKAAAGISALTALGYAGTVIA